MHRDTVHVCELFGGQAHTSTLRARLYDLKRGRNFELQCGVDLLTEKGRHEMWDYINVTRPTVIIMVVVLAHGLCLMKSYTLMQ